MIKQHLIWLITFVGVGLLALAFIYANQLPRVPFVFN
jgi:hypothetical protein